MALTTEERRTAARDLADRIFNGETADVDLDDLLAAVGSIDDAMATVINDIPGAWGTKTIKQAIIDNLPEPFQSTATNPQKALAMSVWAMKEANLI